MPASDDFTSKSKLLARVLRHDPAAAGIVLDSEGWVDVEKLLGGLAERGVRISREALAEIVATNDKQRFALSADATRIRANQGHSVHVELQLREAAPPPVLYHGTVAKNLAGIMREGLRPMARHHVHLSADVATAKAVGGRRGPPAVLVVNSHRMHADGFRFFVSDNGVWLVDAVPLQYLKQR